ncbi:hypothetical protein PV394_15310 [Streptomyces sp. NE06-03E]|uniref:CopG family transcriptional regulator n=3 Tax=Streptomyces TaxID=1883 RepID=A0AAU1LWE6_9ACTN|nr:MULTISPECIES: hypothetical protein [unclassified Streptomyces]WSS63904.1 hypothetical protein OG284_23030 [Streptomyces sp. NBC_01177]WSS70901.1 hypothetical protein OG491_22655 [Streptomyces sp. NBC_01175]WSS77917.1 hypothetical protein OG414_23010 [Streptomyces sp. NBC_01174]MDX3056494.1 hypothetical protein [Streptomyces sp. NE06-03E]MDX3325887.1 hypothetical protein [Streptomyces sp. ME02-6979-3A]
MKQNRSGVTENISVSMPSDLVSELRSRTGRRGLSGYVTEAVRHQLAMDGLAEIVASHEEEHGALTEQEIEAARRELFGDENTARGAA